MSTQQIKQKSSTMSKVQIAEAEQEDDDSLFEQAMCFGDQVSFYDAEHSGFFLCNVSG